MCSETEGHTPHPPTLMNDDYDKQILLTALTRARDLPQQLRLDAGERRGQVHDYTCYLLMKFRVCGECMCCVLRVMCCVGNV